MKGISCGPGLRVDLGVAGLVALLTWAGAAQSRPGDTELVSVALDGGRRDRRH